MTIKGYCTHAADSLEELGVLINSAIKEGWEPLGGVAIGSDTLTQSEQGTISGAVTTFLFVQAMVRRK